MQETTENNSIETLENQALQPIETQEKSVLSDEEILEKCQIFFDFDSEENEQTLENKGLQATQTTQATTTATELTTASDATQETDAVLSDEITTTQETIENNTLEMLEKQENQGNASNEESQETIEFYIENFEKFEKFFLYNYGVKITKELYSSLVMNDLYYIAFHEKQMTYQERKAKIERLIQENQEVAQEEEKTTEINSIETIKTQENKALQAIENTQNRFYGYISVTTHTQSTQMQERHILNYNENTKIYVDKIARKKDKQVEFEKMYKHLKTHGGCVVIDSIRNLAPTPCGAFEKYKLLFDNKIQLVFLQETHLNSQFFYDLLEKQETTILDTVKTALLATIENIINQAFTTLYKRKKAHATATAKGIEKAKSNGAKIGNQKGESRQPKEKAKNLRKIRALSQFFNGSLSDYQLSKKLGITRHTVMKYREELKSMQEKA